MAFALLRPSLRRNFVEAKTESKNLTLGHYMSIVSIATRQVMIAKNSVVSSVLAYHQRQTAHFTYGTVPHSA